MRKDSERNLVWYLLFCYNLMEESVKGGCFRDIGF